MKFATLYNFWTRRWLRTLPNYIFVLLVLSSLSLIFIKDFQLRTCAPYFLFIQNISKPHLIFFGESWSLSVEEWFYLLIPPLLFFLIGFFNLKDKRVIVWVAVLLIITVTIFRYYRFAVELKPGDRAEWGALFYYPVVTRIDSIMFGVIGAYAAFNLKEFWVKFKNKFLFIGIGLFIIDKALFLFNPEYSNVYNCVFSFTILSVATLMLLPYLSELKTGSGYIYTVVTYISLSSYSMYLINNALVSQWMINFLISFLNHVKIYPNAIALYVIKYFFFLTATFIGAIMLYKYIELPFMRLGRKEH